LENTAEIFKNEEDKTVYFALKDEFSEVSFSCKVFAKRYLKRKDFTIKN